MKTLDLKKVIDLVSNNVMNESAKQTLTRASKEAQNLSNVIKACKDDNVWEQLEALFASFDIDSKKELTPSRIVKSLPNELLKKDDEGKPIISIARNVYKYERVFKTREVEGKLVKILKNGEPVTISSKVYDEEGNAVIEDTKLFAVRTWSIRTLIEVLAQASVIKSHRSEIEVEVSEESK